MVRVNLNPRGRVADNEAPNSQRSSGRSLGRKIAIGIVVSSIGYLIGVGLVSVIPQVFYPENADVPSEVSCAEGVRDLRADLLTHAAERVGAGEADPVALRSWFTAWDARYYAIESRCDGTDLERWTLVGRLRHRLQGTLERFDSAEGELARATL